MIAGRMTRFMGCSLIFALMLSAPKMGQPNMFLTHICVAGGRRALSMKAALEWELPRIIR